jgi:hypothetical protein
VRSRQLPPAYFGLNLAFAEAAARAAGVPMADALRRWTNLYLCLGSGDDFAADDPAWRDYLTGLVAADPALYTWQRVQAHGRDEPGPDPTRPGASCGCFRVDLWDRGQLRLHFENADPAGCGPLARARLQARRAELAELFASVQRHLPEARTVVGGSWLYNLDAYRRLFPPDYLATAYPSTSEAELRYLSLWGQFLDHEGDVKAHLAEPFLARLRAADLKGIAAVQACLPFQVLRLEAPVTCFHRHFGT